MNILLTVVLLLAPNFPTLAASPPRPLHRGAIIIRDCGFWNAAKDRGGKWISLPTVLVLEGRYASNKRLLVFRRFDGELAGDSHLLQMNGARNLPLITDSDISVTIRR